MLGLKFLRQHKIEHSNWNGERAYFFVDFYCNELKLIIEVDGGIHKSQIEYDKERESILNEMGYAIFRIRNEEVNSILRINELKTYCQQIVDKETNT